MIPFSDLLDAADWGDGFCLACGERSHTVVGPNAEECDECGTIAVLPALTILSFQAKLDTTPEEDEDNTSLG